MFFAKSSIKILFKEEKCLKCFLATGHKSGFSKILNFNHKQLTWSAAPVLAQAKHRWDCCDVIN